MDESTMTQFFWFAV